MKWVIVAAALFLFGFVVVAGENLVVNGGFDVGDNAADNWEKPDGLTSFWVNEPGRGRVLKLDSSIDRTQVMAWWEERKKNPVAMPPVPKLPADPLASIGGTEGVSLDSDFIMVKPGQNYKLSVDYKGKFKPFIWIKGFMMHPKRKIPVDCYQTRLEPSGGPENEWRTYSIGFNPTAKKSNTDRMKVRIYAYWPAGVYYFDQIRIEEITPEEMSELVKKRGDVSQ